MFKQANEFYDLQNFVLLNVPSCAYRIHQTDIDGVRMLLVLMNDSVHCTRVKYEPEQNAFLRWSSCGAYENRHQV